MDEMLIFRKMESLGRCVDRVRFKRGVTHEELLRNFDLQDILSVNLQRAVQLSVDIALHILANLSGTLPDTMGEAFIALREHGVISESRANALRSSVGLRIVAVHDYVAVNWQIVHDVAERHVEVFAEYMREVERWMAGAMRGRDPGPRRDMRITVKVYQVQRDKMWKAFGADSKIFFRVTCG